MSRLDTLREVWGDKCAEGMTEDSHAIWFPSDEDIEKAPEGAECWMDYCWIATGGIYGCRPHRWPKEIKFKVGSVWLYNGGSQEVARITESDEAEILYSDMGGKGDIMGTFYLDESNTPFYAPPTQEQLDEWGMEIDRIDAPTEGDNWIGWKYGNICKDDGSAFPDHKFNGLRYILKKKEPANTIDACIERIKAELETIKEMV